MAAKLSSYGPRASKRHLQSLTMRALPSFVLSKLARPVARMSSSSSGAAKLWGGRFTGKTDPLMERAFSRLSLRSWHCKKPLTSVYPRQIADFNNSMPFDKRMWAADITGSQKYAAALAKCGIISAAERDALVSGLEKVCNITLSGLVPCTPFPCCSCSVSVSASVGGRSGQSGPPEHSRSRHRTKTFTRRTSDALASLSVPLLASCTRDAGKRGRLAGAISLDV